MSDDYEWEEKITTLFPLNSIPFGRETYPFLVIPKLKLAHEMTEIEGE